MQSDAARSVESYLARLPADRREALSALRRVIRRHLPSGYEEGLLYGMPSYYVPLSRYPRTYNGQPLTLASLASQKNHMSLYLMSVYGDRDTERWLSDAFRDAGKRLDMGKSCVRFKALEELPVEVIGEAIGRVGVEAFIARYEASRAIGGGEAGATERPAPAMTRRASETRPAKKAGAAARGRSAKKRSKKAAASAKAGSAPSPPVEGQRGAAKKRGRAKAAAPAKPASRKKRRVKPSR